MGDCWHLTGIMAWDLWFVKGLRLCKRLGGGPLTNEAARIRFCGWPRERHLLRQITALTQRLCDAVDVLLPCPRRLRLGPKASVNLFPRGSCLCLKSE